MRVFPYDSAIVINSDLRTRAARKASQVNPGLRTRRKRRLSHARADGPAKRQGRT